MRPVLSEESRFVDSIAISPSQIKAGSQAFHNLACDEFTGPKVSFATTQNLKLPRVQKTAAEDRKKNFGYSTA